MPVKLKSAYMPPEPQDGKRYLVETFWPEGTDTFSLRPYRWIREIAPSYGLVNQASYNHWSPEQFREEYWKELQEPAKKAWFERLQNEAKQETVTILGATRKRSSRIGPSDTSAFFLKEFIEGKVPDSLQTQK